MATDEESALKQSKKLGYPVMVRPSFVLGGRAMEIVYRSEPLLQSGPPVCKLPCQVWTLLCAACLCHGTCTHAAGDCVIKFVFRFELLVQSVTTACKLPCHDPALCTFSWVAVPWTDMFRSVNRWYCHLCTLNGNNPYMHLHVLTVQQVSIDCTSCVGTALPTQLSSVGKLVQQS